MFDKHVAVEANCIQHNNNNNNMDESESSLPTSVCIAVLDRTKLPYQSLSKPLFQYLSKPPLKRLHLIQVGELHTRMS